MQHQISLETLSHFVNLTELAGSGEGNGKQLLLRTEIDHQGHVISTFQVRTGTDDPNSQNVGISTRQLQEAMDKYNSI